jgi:diguanylate cyclase (GGDEF)-like protein
VGAGIQSAPAATLLVAARRPALAVAWATWSAVFGIPLGGIAALSFVIALRWLRLMVREPLTTLIRRKHERPDEWLARLPTERPDEVGLIARETGELVAQLDELHSQVESLRRTIDSRVALRTREINAQLREARQKNWIDPLTKLGNRRLLDERLNELFSIERQSGDDFSVVMFDVDNFKAHNDQMGHSAGDDLLRFIGRLLSGSLRDTDLAIRYAGDEFVILLPDTSQEHAVNLTDRIVRLFAQQASLLKTRPLPTLSAGVASARHCGARQAQELIELADAALYEAKGAGKNVVRAATHRQTTGSFPAKAAG